MFTDQPIIMRQIIKYFIILSFTTSFFIQCKNNKGSAPIDVKDSLVLVTTTDDVRIRSKAGENGKEIKRVSKSTSLYYLNEISDFTTKVTIQGIKFNDPWLKVQLGDGTQGWVYAGYIKFDTKNKGQQLSNAIITKRLANFFGTNAGQLIEKYQKLYKEAETSLEFAEMYKTGQELRDTLIVNLQQIDFSQSPEVPDLFWVNEPLPALVPTRLPEGGVGFSLFFDYKELYKKALQTVDKEDDAFVELNFLVYSTDSMEYYYPSWFLPNEAFMGGNSLFGEGIHQEVIAKLDSMKQQGDIFKLPVESLKNTVLMDIVTNNNYWRGQDEVLEELKNIIAADYSIFNPDDKMALEERVKMFQNPSEFDINLNMRDK